MVKAPAAANLFAQDDRRTKVRLHWESDVVNTYRRRRRRPHHVLLTPVSGQNINTSSYDHESKIRLFASG